MMSAEQGGRVGRHMSQLREQTVTLAQCWDSSQNCWPCLVAGWGQQGASGASRVCGPGLQNPSSLTRQAVVPQSTQGCPLPPEL